MLAQTSGRICREAEPKAPAFREAWVEWFHLRGRCQQIIRIVKGIAPVGLYGRLHDDYRPAAAERFDEEKKSRAHGTLHMDLAFTKLIRFERLEEVPIFGLPGRGRKGHTKALVDMIAVPQPRPPGPRPVGVAAYVDQ